MTINSKTVWYYEAVTNDNGSVIYKEPVKKRICLNYQSMRSNRYDVSISGDSYTSPVLVTLPKCKNFFKEKDRIQLSKPTIGYDNSASSADYAVSNIFNGLTCSFIKLYKLSSGDGNN